jgi:hypothetical protein
MTALAPFLSGLPAGPRLALFLGKENAYMNNQNNNLKGDKTKDASITKKIGDAVEKFGDKVEHAGMKKLGDAIESLGDKIEHSGDKSKVVNKDRKTA